MVSAAFSNLAVYGAAVRSIESFSVAGGVQSTQYVGRNGRRRVFWKERSKSRMQMVFVMENPSPSKFPQDEFHHRSNEQLCRLNKEVRSRPTNDKAALRGSACPRPKRHERRVLPKPGDDAAEKTGSPKYGGVTSLRSEVLYLRGNRMVDD